ncbi:MAG: hypothetical protein ABSG35_24460, partial [Syntrophobacteraceae bacterium]
GDIDEYKQAFSLVHDTYLRMGYLSTPKPHGMLFGIHTLLPQTVIFVAKTYLTVISTLTEIFDTEQFGLPMDELYQKELDGLRSEGRKIVEISALVTPANFRWMNLFMYINKLMFHYSLDHGVNDLCIAVNPRHVSFYKNILLFEDLGPKRYYPKVNAPAVALRLNMDCISEKSKSAYDGLDFESNVHAYFHGEAGLRASEKTWAVLPGEDSPENGYCYWTPENVKYFLLLEKSILDGLNGSQKEFLLNGYPGLASL